MSGASRCSAGMASSYAGSCSQTLSSRPLIAPSAASCITIIAVTVLEIEAQTHLVSRSAAPYDLVSTTLPSHTIPTITNSSCGVLRKCVWTISSSEATTPGFRQLMPTWLDRRASCPLGAPVAGSIFCSPSAAPAGAHAIAEKRIAMARLGQCLTRIPAIPGLFLRSGCPRSDPRSATPLRSLVGMQGNCKPETIREAPEPPSDAMKAIDVEGEPDLAEDDPAGAILLHWHKPVPAAPVGTHYSPFKP